MTNITVALPDPLHEWIEARAKAEKLGDAADYVRELISRDRERSEAVARMRALVYEGFASGTSDRTMDEVLDEARAIASSAEAHSSFAEFTSPTSIALPPSSRLS